MINYIQEKIFLNFWKLPKFKTVIFEFSLSLDLMSFFRPVHSNPEVCPCWCIRSSVISAAQKETKKFIFWPQEKKTLMSSLKRSVKVLFATFCCNDLAKNHPCCRTRVANENRVGCCCVCQIQSSNFCKNSFIFVAWMFARSNVCFTTRVDGPKARQLTAAQKRGCNWISSAKFFWKFQLSHSFFLWLCSDLRAFGRQPSCEETPTQFSYPLLRQNFGCWSVIDKISFCKLEICDNLPHEFFFSSIFKGKKLNFSK